MLFISVVLSMSAMLAILFTSSPFYTSLGVVMISFSFGLFLVYSGTPWFFFSLVIMFLGGMMVVFVYASSLGSNFVMSFSVKGKYVTLLVVLSIILMWMYCDLNIVNMNQSLVSIYSLQSFIFIFVLGSILLSVLFVVSKVVSSNDGAMKL